MRPLTAYLRETDEKVKIIDSAYIHDADTVVYLVIFENNKERLVCEENLKDIK